MTDTASTSIRNAVNNQRNASSSVTTTQKTQTTSNASTKSTTLHLIKASTAMYRAQTSASSQNPYTPSEEDKKAFTEAQHLVAKKRGIKPDKNGQYKKKHLEKELSPLEIIKQLSFDHCVETSNGKNSTEEINNSFQNVYTDEQNDTTETIPQELTNICNGLQKITTFHTLTDFLGLPEEQQKKYLEDISEFGAEKDFLTKALEEHSKGKDHKAVDIKQGKDPGTPKVGGKDYSSKQTDIIQWMMEQILAFGDWCGNKIIDATTTPVYGLLAKGIDLLGESWDSFKDGLKEKKEKKENQTASSEKVSEKTTPSLENFINESLARKEDLYNKLNKETFEPGFDFLKNLINNNISLDGDGYIQNGKKNKYSTLSTAYTEEQIYKILRTTKDFFNENTLAALKINQNPNNDENINNALSEWYNQTIQNTEKKNKGEQTNPVNLPDILKNNGYTDEKLKNSVNEIQNQIFTGFNLQSITERISNSAELFATNYAMYKIIEEARLNESFDMANIDNLKSKYQKEGAMIMYQNYQALRNGDKNASSPESMIELSEEMFNKSKELYDKGDKESQVENLFEEKTPSSANDETPCSLNEFAENMTLNDWENTEKESLAHLNNEIAILEKDQTDNDNLRNKIQKMKEKHKNRDDHITSFSQHISQHNLGAKKYTPPNTQGNSK